MEQTFLEEFRFQATAVPTGNRAVDSGPDSARLPWTLRQLIWEGGFHVGNQNPSRQHKMLKAWKHHVRLMVRCMRFDEMIREPWINSQTGWRWGPQPETYNPDLREAA